MKKLLIWNILFLVLFSGIAVGQYDEEWRRQEEEERNRKTLADAVASLQPSYQSFVNQLMIDEKGAWLVSIGKHGGFTGRTSSLIAAVNSSGILACSEKNASFSTSLLDLDLILPVEQIIKSSDLKSLKKQFESSGSFCSDCFVYSMEITYRKGKKAKTYSFAWSIFPESSPEIKSLYEAVLDSAQCP